MKTKTKRQFVADLLTELKFERIAAREVSEVNRQLVLQYGPGGRMSASEIGKLADEAGYDVDLLALSGMGKDDQYAADFDHVLKFNDLRAAKKSIHAIDALFKKYRAIDDKLGETRALQEARRGKHWAAVMSKNKKISDLKRAEKAEIAEWFGLWLRTPELFDTWIELRKNQLIKERPEWLDPGALSD
jgi:hypothetical protein